MTVHQLFNVIEKATPGRWPLSRAIRLALFEEGFQKEADWMAGNSDFWSHNPVAALYLSKLISYDSR